MGIIKQLYKTLFNDSVRRRIALARDYWANPKRLPSDVVFFKNKAAIFIHIPKSAGVSIYKSLFDTDSFGHVPLTHYQKNMSKKEFDSSYKFTFVRNPYDRLHSAYTYLKQGGRKRPIDLEYSKRIKKVDSFEEFVLKSLKDDNIWHMQHFKPQVEYLKDMGNTINLNFIGKFESLESDFNYVASKLNVNKKLGVLNKTKADRKNYMTYYSQEMLQLVNDLYHDDFQSLGYQKK